MAQGVDWSTPAAASYQNDERRRGKRDSAFLLQHGKQLLERLNNVSKVQGLLVFVAVDQTFGKELIKKMSASTFMFFNCCQCACEKFTSKATPIMIRWKHWYFHRIIGVPDICSRRDNP